MPDNEKPKPRRLYVDSEREENDLSASQTDKERDAQELRELANDVKRKIASENISTPEITELLAQVDSAIDAKDFMKAAKIFKDIMTLIGLNNRFGSRYKSFGLDNYFPAFLK